MGGTVATDWDVGLPRWREVLRRSEQATFFHTPGWYQTHAEIGGAAVRALGFRWPDGQEALLPLALRSRYRGWVTEALAGVENGYGGLLSPQPLPSHRIEEAYAQVRARYPNLRVLGNPLGRQSVPAHGRVIESFTQAVPILEPSVQVARMSGMRQRNLRTAEKAAFALERIHPVVPSDARDLYPIYLEHSARWQYRRWVRDEAYFRALFRHAGHELTLFVAHHGGERAGFILLGCWGETIVELHLATRSAKDRLQVGTYLIAKSLEWAHGAGYRVFDFLPSGTLDGIIAFKESFGAERLGQVEVVQDSLWGRGLAILRGAMARETLAASH
jgi:CelD/BcsL family acetyltransferase involved in cellulose biosynthesis